MCAPIRKCPCFASKHTHVCRDKMTQCQEFALRHFRKENVDEAGVLKSKMLLILGEYNEYLVLIILLYFAYV